MKQLCNHHCTCLIRAAPSWRQTLATHIQLGLLRSNTISDQQTHLPLTLGTRISQSYMAKHSIGFDFIKARFHKS